MKLHLRVAFRVAAFVLLAACGGKGDPTPIGPGTNGSIRGTVIDNTGATVASASVALTGNAQTARTTTSGADGVYTFADVLAGTYTLTVTPPNGFTLDATGTASVTVADGAQANASAIVLKRVIPAADSCTVEPGSLRPGFGVATAAERSLFAYDASAPLNLQKAVESTNNDVEVSAISYNSPAGGSVTGLLFNPVARSSLRPGIVLMHGLPGNARQMAGYAQALAQYGAVVIAIDAPHARRSGQAGPVNGA